ncbi:MAG: hypothetical protein JST68_12320 [Bacteroidetes bacterium]|nr:hypothetical protein [Bacteroidota bacterium]
MFIGKFLVGVAGHNSSYSILDYIGHVFIIITVGLLMVLASTKHRTSRFGRIVRYAAMTLVLISVGFGIYELYTMLKDTEFGSGENFMMAGVFLFIIISSIVFWGLVRNAGVDYKEC